MPKLVSLEALGREAARLWRELTPGSVVWLTGELGSGKTTFVQAVAKAAGAESARSPSFALVHEYHSPHGVLVHADCYRLREPAEALDLDLIALQRRARLLLIEWPERAGAYAPPPDAHIVLSHAHLPDRRVLERVA
ncbi:MAG: tRNA (adenosine(37)-N6)-threonylcarbamoyltransferase complex ATPase subunit type 1 TsaE [Gemmatimonadales bacterium]|nr:tRNA (adenosine(37)-N6)-threonylcarbamoyltransferase complex ATPase subunit type 1 TsaE [Gemmatimonadales bacterium]NIN09853.1 tRNA (adenosine(37)-N6)-threonylcarbamoyltransferase complex ATPase subunit type 1 TsaE [Gemmatimonadales bacterium]NIN48557.1 tRNA (adenosine(37)-N6)-threonylcarbamoyltransferase complex ATPase subunit type 1 TsaE [Gemmatimonadales bacterium]NIP06021.1 tRNA (adenosine(37)-N6)-threonylcarbamoyltransferase complex ATPase subunit type 1 TsaE [Gemmatimonadales bacterium]